MTEEIIDVHAHIIPGVDDGAPDWETAEGMLWLSYQQGIRTIIATPHWHQKQDIDLLIEEVGKLQELAWKIDRKYTIKLGQEIMYFEDLVDTLKANRALSLAASRYILVEFHNSISLSKLLQDIRKMVMAGFFPVLAHVERYQSIRKKGVVEELTEAGCYMQMNYESLKGRIPNQDTLWCRREVLKGSIHFLGTDMHHLKYRTPEIIRVLKWLKRHCGKEQFDRMTRHNAKNILTDEIIGDTRWEESYGQQK